ncbi:hypothetical protein Tco_0595491 [Tanacetum coccineum]
MNPQEIQQVTARDEKWVPSTERVNISTTNVRLETTVQQKEEAFQVVINIIKNSTCFKAFTISADVPKIFMHQFWYKIKKVKESKSYEFLLANKKCIIDAEVFRKILDICPRVKGEEFTPVQDDDDTLTFLTDLGYKGLLYKHTNMFIDHMHQPWRTLAAIINKCLSGKTSSNDKLRKFRFDILWGMFYRENVDYPELIWEDFAFQIDHKKEKKSRRKTMPFPRFTKDDGIVSRLKFVRLGEDYQEYGLAIPDVMLNNAIKQSESYQMFIKYSTEFIPEPAKKKTGSRSTRSVVTQDTLSAPKSKPAASKPKLKGVQSLTPEEQEAVDVMQVLKESKKTNIRQLCTRGSSEGTCRIPGVPDESTVISATLSEGTGTKPGVLNEENVSTKEKVILKWGSEHESKYSEEDLSEEEEVDWIDSDDDEEKKDDTDDDKSIDLEMTDDEETDDEVLQGKEQVNDDDDEDMSNAKVKESRNDDEEDTNAAKADAEKTEEAKDDPKKAELPSAYLYL